MAVIVVNAFNKRTNNYEVATYNQAKGKIKFRDGVEENEILVDWSLPLDNWEQKKEFDKERNRRKL